MLRGADIPPATAEHAKIAGRQREARETCSPHALHRHASRASTPYHIRTRRAASCGPVVQRAAINSLVTPRGFQGLTLAVLWNCPGSRRASSGVLRRCSFAAPAVAVARLPWDSGRDRPGTKPVKARTPVPPPARGRRPHRAGSNSVFSPQRLLEDGVVEVVIHHQLLEPGVRAFQLREPAGVVGLHRAILVLPAVEGLLADLQPPVDGGDGLAPASSVTAWRSWGMICSGACCLRFIERRRGAA